MRSSIVLIVNLSFVSLHAQQEIPLPVFSTDRGLFEEAFELKLYKDREFHQILYTLDGSDPRAEEAKVYHQAIPIDKTTILRAVIKAEKEEFSEVITYSYIFPEDVAKQAALPDGYPKEWGFFTDEEGRAAADYEMDPEITQDPFYKDRIIPALKSLPTVSLVTDKSHFFSPIDHPDSGGIYMFTITPERERALWEKPVSLEYIPHDEQKSIQLNAGLRLHGGQSRLPSKTPKHSFRLAFRGKYGPKKMEYDLFGETATDRFDNLVLLAGFNLTWTHFVGKQRKHAHYIADSWTKDAFRRMGYISAHNKFCHLYLNGLYWGVYNLSERLDEEFMESYLGEQEEDYDIFKDFEEMKNGNYEAWGEMLDLSHDPQNYLRIQGKNEQGANDPSLPNYLDMDQFIDYMILNFYIGNLDWDMHNWVVARNRKEPGKGFKFFPWDSEHSFLSVNHDVTKDYVEKRASYFFHVLKENPFFQQKFSDRAKSLLGKGGILSPDSVAYHWREKSEEISLALIAESARWGDYRRDVHSYKLGPYNLYTPKSQWNIEQKRLFDTYFPIRSARVLRILRS